MKEWFQWISNVSLHHGLYVLVCCASWNLLRNRDHLQETLERGKKFDWSAEIIQVDSKRERDEQKNSKKEGKEKHDIAFYFAQHHHQIRLRRLQSFVLLSNHLVVHQLFERNRKFLKVHVQLWKVIDDLQEKFKFFVTYLRYTCICISASRWLDALAFDITND